MTLRLTAPCNLLVTAASTPARLSQMCNQYHADGIDPMAYRCARCHLHWDGSPADDYKTVTCSNCYSDNVWLTRVRLAFDNRGQNNDGAKAQRERFEKAKLLADRADRDGTKVRN